MAFQAVREPVRHDSEWKWNPPTSKMDADGPWGRMLTGDGKIPQIGRLGETVPARFTKSGLIPRHSEPYLIQKRGDHIRESLRTEWRILFAQSRKHTIWKLIPPIHLRGTVIEQHLQILKELEIPPVDQMI